MQPVGNDDRANGEAPSTVKKDHRKQVTSAAGAMGDNGNERTVRGGGSTTRERNISQNKSKVYYKTLKVQGLK